jgi:VanZ family protein
MALLFYLSSRSGFAAVPSGWDKVAHAGAYTVLGVLALRACHGGLHRLAPGPALAALLVTAGYAVLDELHQGRVPGRDASGLDWLADLGGAGIAVVVVAALVWVRSKLSQRGVPAQKERP